MEDEYRVKMAGVIVENRDRVNPRIISFIIIVVYFYNSDNVILKVYIEAIKLFSLPFNCGESTSPMHSTIYVSILPLTRSD